MDAAGGRRSWNGNASKWLLSLLLCSVSAAAWPWVCICALKLDISSSLWSIGSYKWCRWPVLGVAASLWGNWSCCLAVGIRSESREFEFVTVLICAILVRFKQSLLHTSNCYEPVSLLLCTMSNFLSCSHNDHTLTYVSPQNASFVSCTLSWPPIWMCKSKMLTAIFLPYASLLKKNKCVFDINERILLNSCLQRCTQLSRQSIR